jgi:hypothetical protein
MYQPNYDVLDPITKARVRAWMRRFAGHYANPTLLAEACGDDLSLGHGFPPTIPEDVFEIALEFFPEEDD